MGGVRSLKGPDKRELRGCDCLQRKTYIKRGMTSCVASRQLSQMELASLLTAGTRESKRMGSMQINDAFLFFLC